MALFLPTLHSTLSSSSSSLRTNTAISHSSNLSFSSVSRFNLHNKPRIAISANLAAEASKQEAVVKEKSVSVILLAGGKGTRMGASMPKQYLSLLSQPIALYSFYTFSRMPQVKEIIVVCDPSYKDIFQEAESKI